MVAEEGAAGASIPRLIIRLGVTGAALESMGEAEVAAGRLVRAADRLIIDNLLGRLYQPGEVESFEGVLGKELSNPIPEWAEHGADRGVVPYGVAKDMNTPYPDPGEEYPHINTQLFGGSTRRATEACRPSR